MPLNEATVDKLLGANFLSLALIALVMVVAMFLLFVFMDYRRQQADNRRQDAFLRVFTDEKSPMVTNSRRVADVLDKTVEQNGDIIEWHKKHEIKIDALTTDVKTRSELDGQAIEEVRKDAEERHTQVNTRFDNMETTLTEIKEKVDKLPATVDEAKKEILAAIEKCRETKSNLIPDTPAASPETPSTGEQATAA